MNRIGASVVATLGVISLSGCMGNGSVATADQLIDQGYDLLAEHQNNAVTPIANMPDSGSAVYRGIAAYGPTGGSVDTIVANATSVSEVEMEANFATSRLSGQAANFQATELAGNVELDGSLDFDGTISGNSFNGTVRGTVSENGTPVNYQGSMSGNFSGDNAEAMVGAGAADAYVNGYYYGTAYGAWIADQP